MRTPLLGCLLLACLLATTGCAELKDLLHDARTASTQPSVQANEKTGAQVGGFVGGAVAGPAGTSIGESVGYIVGGLLTVGGLVLASRKNRTAENLHAHSAGVVNAISALAPIVASTIEQPNQS